MACPLCPQRNLLQQLSRHLHHATRLPLLLIQCWRISSAQRWCRQAGTWGVPPRQRRRLCRTPFMAAHSNTHTTTTKGT